MRLLFTSSDNDAAQREAKNAAEIIKNAMCNFPDTQIMVSPAPIERLHDKFRWHVVVKYNCNSEDAHEELHNAVKVILDENEFSAVHIAVDFSPSSLM